MTGILLRNVYIAMSIMTFLITVPLKVNLQNAESVQGCIRLTTVDQLSLNVLIV